MDNSSSHGKRALLTGITGQDGSYLAELLLSKGYQIWGIVRRCSTANTRRIDHLLGDARDPNARLKLCHGDLSDTTSIDAIVEQVMPDEVYNLGAQSHVKVSFEVPEYTCDVTGLGTLRLLESVRSHCPDARFMQASSSEVFGKVQEWPQTESTPFHPRSPYGVAKSFAYFITQNYREAYGMFAVNGIFFNHESPRRGETFVTRKITRAVAGVVRGTQQCLFLGNLDAQRDWGFAGDYVQAMWQMLQTPEPTDFVIATGVTKSVREFCSLAFRCAGRPVTWIGQGVAEKGVDANGQVLVEVDERYFRPAEVDRLVGDASKARRVLGWEPNVRFEELVEMMVRHELTTTD